MSLTKEEKKILKGISNKRHRGKVENNFMTTHQIQKVLEELGNPADLAKYATIARKDIKRVDEVNNQYELFRNALSDTVERAKNIWDLDYAAWTDGLYPSGNQIGRRDVMPEDFGRKSWKHQTGQDWKSDRVPFINCVLDEDAFLLISGLAYRPVEGESLKGVSHPLSGVTLPFQATGAKWKMIDGWYTHMYDVSVVLCPESRLEVNIFEDPPGQEFELQILGNIVGKRTYIIKEPWQLNVMSHIRNNNIIDTDNNK